MMISSSIALTPVLFSDNKKSSKKKPVAPEPPKETKPSPTSLQIRSSRLSFFSAPTEPVRIDAMGFLGLRPPPPPPPPPEPPKVEVEEEKVVRFRTIGDMTCTGAIESDAKTVDEIIGEVAAARQTERGTRADDKRSETAMEDRKKQGYF